MNDASSIISSSEWRIIMNAYERACLKDALGIQEYSKPPEAVLANRAMIESASEPFQDKQSTVVIRLPRTKFYEIVRANPAKLCESYLLPKKVIYSGTKTIVLWNDGTKTIVSLSEDQKEFDPEAGFAMALMKKLFGTRSAYKRMLKKVSEYGGKKQW